MVNCRRIVKSLWFVSMLTYGVGSAVLAADAPQPASAEQSYQGKSLFGEDLYTKRNSNLNVAQPTVLARAANDAQSAFEKEITPDTATWYGRVLAYQGLMKEAIVVYDAGLKRFPDSAKLLRHRAHRYFSLRRFDESIKDGLKAAQLYAGRPLEREKLGPDYSRARPTSCSSISITTSGRRISPSTSSTPRRTGSPNPVRWR
jgi:tetratricopeptide (TPR) repeat protein